MRISNYIDTFDGIKYQVIDNRLCIWNSTVNEYIFEKTVNSITDIEETITFLKEQGFIRP